MRCLRLYVLLGPVIVVVLAACLSTDPGRTLTPPDSEQPAAGICSAAAGPVAVIEVEVDVPAPRCQQVRREQRLKIVNNTDQSVLVRLGPFATRVPPHAEGTINQPFGRYLAPGVHRLAISAYGDGGAELWLQS
jgi:hypothetical protein